MKKFLGWALAILVIVGVVGYNAYQHREQKSDKPVVKIGLVYPMSGAMGHIGKGVMNSANMVLNKINQDPDRQFNYQLIAQDDEMKAPNTITIANKLIGVDKINVLMTSWSGPSNAAKPLMIENNLIHFTDSYTTLSDGKNIFNCSVTNEDLAPMAFDFIKKRNAKKVALIFQQVPAGAEILSMLEPKLKESGIKYDEYLYGGTEFDAFRTMVASVKANNYDLILLYGWSPGIVFVARELKSQEVNVPVLGFDTVETANYDFTYFDGIYEIGKPYKQEWEEFLKSKHPDAVYMYDAMNVIVNTYEKAGKQLGRIPTTKEFRDIMYQQRDYQGLIGNVHLEDNGLLRVPTFLKRIEGNKIIPVEE